MKELFLDLMIFTGSALMAYNIYGYVCFSRDVRKHGNWDQMQRLFNLPILLLILFFIGYLVVGIFGKPDLVMAGILFGGSIFVFVMLLLIRRTFDRIQENEQLEARLLAAGYPKHEGYAAASTEGCIEIISAGIIMLLYKLWFRPEFEGQNRGMYYA